MPDEPPRISAQRSRESAMGKGSSNGAATGPRRCPSLPSASRSAGAAGSSARETLVAEPVRLVGGGAQLLVPETLVVADVALEEADLAIALEREDVGRDPIQEPAIVTDDDDAA